MTTSRSTPNTAPSGTPGALHIAVGIVQNARGEVLVCQRPAHKSYPGEWEFPGGKVERGESVEVALRRELQEELGIDVAGSRPLIRLRHVYPEFEVDLDTWVVTGYRGEARSTEHPATAWVAPHELPRWPLLAADRPIVNALRLPSQLVITPPHADIAELRERLAALPSGALLRLRLPAADDRAYAAAARLLAPACAARGLTLVVDRGVDLALELDAAWHARADVLARLERRPVDGDRWFGASVHSAGELLRARECGADFVVLGPVHETPTHPGQSVLRWEGFATLARGAGLPVYAVGGLGPADLEQAWAHGAQGIGGITAYWRGKGGGVSSGS